MIMELGVRSRRIMSEVCACWVRRIMFAIIVRASWELNFEIFDRILDRVGPGLGV